MNPQQEDRDVTDNSAYNPFPEPQTIPAGWDTSGFFSTPQIDSVMDEDDSTES
jgi:uncharacterized protein YbdZ (MbtH family)